MIKSIDEIFEQDEEKRKLNINDGKWRMCDLLLLAGDESIRHFIECKEKLVFIKWSTGT